jgi:hypothetical protein
MPPANKVLRSLRAINESGNEVDRLFRELDTSSRDAVADGVKKGDPRLAGFLQLRWAKMASEMGRYGIVWRKTYTAHVLVLLPESGELIVTVRGLCRDLFPEKLSSSVICRSSCGSDGVVRAVNEALCQALSPPELILIGENRAHRRFLMTGEHPAADREEASMFEGVAGGLTGTPGCRPGDDDAVVTEYYRNRAALITSAASENVETCFEFLDLCFQIERQCGVPLFNVTILDDTSSLFVVFLDGAGEKRVRAKIGKQRARRQKAYELLARGVSGHALDEALAVIEGDAWEVQPWSAFCDRLTVDPGAFAPDIASYLRNPLLHGPLVLEQIDHLLSTRT